MGEFLGISTVYLAGSIYLIGAVVTMVVSFVFFTRMGEFDTQGDRILWPTGMGIFWFAVLIILAAAGLLQVAILLKKGKVRLWAWKSEPINSPRHQL